MKKSRLSREEQQFIELYHKSAGLILYARNFTRPSGRSSCFALTVLGEKDPYDQDKRLFIRMDRLFEILGLNLEKLSQIFVEEPWNYYENPSARVIQPTAKSYADLGICRACDDEGWKNLAMLMEKNIFQIHEHGGDPPEYFDRAIYYSNGMFSILDPNTWPVFGSVDPIDSAILMKGVTYPQSSRIH